MVVIHVSGARLEPQYPSRKHSNGAVFPWPFVGHHGIGIPDPVGLKVSQHGLDPTLKTDKTVARVVHIAQPWHDHQASGQSVVPFDVRFIKLGQAVAPVLEMHFVLPITAQNFQQ